MIGYSDNADFIEDLNPDYSERMGRTISTIIPNFVASGSGARSIISGPPGSGKSHLINSLFSKKPRILRNIFNRVYLFIPAISWDSVERSPFQQLEQYGRIFHDLSELENLLPELEQNKEQNFESCVIIDDFGDVLNQREIQQLLNKLMIKSRHYKTNVYILTQTAFQLPKELRRLIKVHHLYQYPRDDFYLLMRQIIGKRSEEYYDQIYDFAYSSPYRFLTIQTEYTPPRMFVNGREIHIENNP